MRDKFSREMEDESEIKLTHVQNRSPVFSLKQIDSLCSRQTLKNNNFTDQGCVDCSGCIIGSFTKFSR